MSGVQTGPGAFTTFVDVVDALPADAEAEVGRALEAYLREPVAVTLVPDPERATGRLPSGKRRAFTRAWPGPGRA